MTGSGEEIASHGGSGAIIVTVSQNFSINYRVFCRIRGWGFVLPGAPREQSETYPVPLCIYGINELTLQDGRERLVDALTSICELNTR